MGENIYYHFFDRELRQSVKVVLSDEEICKIISVSLLMTDGVFYLPISNLYESLLEFPCSVNYIIKLESLGIVRLVSSHNCVENFILSRQELYKHDKDRYPMYFNDYSHPWTSNLIVLKDSTTKILRNKFSDIQIQIKELNDDRNYIVTKSIREIAENDKNKAITYSLFKDSISSMGYSNLEHTVISNDLRKKISEFYIQRYLNITSGTLVTGIIPVQYYDFLAKNTFTTNYYLYTLILKTIGLDINSSSFFKLVLSFRKEKSIFELLSKKLNDLMQSLFNILKDNKIVAFNECTKYLYSDKKYPEINDNLSLYKNILAYLSDIYDKHKNLQMEMENMNKTNKSVVIVAVTDTEMKALLDAIKKHYPSQFLTEKILGDFICKELIGFKNPVYIVQSEMGISGSGSIINTLHKVHNHLNPEKILMVGIAFGIDKEKQKIGDILVSKQVWNYEPSKITNSSNISRGDKVSASSFLLQLFRSIGLEHHVDVHFGLLASGEKLINSEQFLAKLKESEKEIIGGDMEAAGLVSVCSDKHIDWIIIKAICDWGYEKTNASQELAAENACNFLLKGLSKIIS